MYFLKQYWYVILIIILILAGLMLRKEPNSQENSIVFESAIEQEGTPLQEEEELNESEVFVDIKGAIHSPGVYLMKTGDRVEAAIELAGGLKEEADSNQVNLAEQVYDEMVIYIPAKSEEDVYSSDVHTGTEKIKINLASIEELTTLPGIGQSKATAIIEYREQYGKFKNIEDLTNVSGIGEKTAERLAEFIIIP